MASTRCVNCGQWANEGHECPEVLTLGSKTPRAPTMKSPGTTNKNQVVWDEKDDVATVTINGSRIVSLEELLESAKVDMKEWLVERHVINKWEIGAKDEDGNIVVEPLFQVKVWLKPVKAFATVLAEIEDAKALMESARPTFIGLKSNTSKGDCMVEISIPDPHFGMYAWGEETGAADYDVNIAARNYQDALETLIERIGPTLPSEYLYVIGNDGVHADGPIVGSNAGGSTARGTAQDVDTRLKKVFRTKRDCIIACANKMARDKTVHIVVVGGNHDTYASFYLGEVLSTYFRDHPNVTVDNTATQRKYVQWGQVALGFTHGSEEKPDQLPLIMAQEEPQMWADTTYREWHLGHLHKKMGASTQDADEYSGVRVRWMPSIAPIDAWHASKGYRHQRSAEALVWHKTEGQIGSANFNIGIG